MNNYKGYIPISEQDKEFIVFSEFDEETKLPNTVQEVSTKDRFNTLLVYSIISNEFGYYTIEDYRDEDMIITMQAKGDRIIHSTETDKFTKDSREFVPLAKDKFYYQEGKRNAEGDLEPTLEMQFDKKDYSKCYYKELVDGKWITYNLNKSNNMWEKS